MSKIYYVYRHVRLDKNEVFYIGKGTIRPTGKSETVYYYRAFQKSGQDRSIFWRNITRKTDYIVEIIFQSQNIQEIFRKEREFVKLYGRRDLNLGTLVNMTDGGDGATNNIASEKQKLLLKARSKMQIGEKHPRSKPVYVYKTDGTFFKKFANRLITSKELNITPRNVHLCLRGTYQQLNGFVFVNKYKGEFLHFQKRIPTNHKTILCHTLTEISCHEFTSACSAARFLNISHKKLLGLCRRSEPYHGYLMTFKT